MAELAVADEDELGPDVTDAQVAELGGPKTARAQDREHGTIAGTLARRQVRSQREGDHLGFREELGEQTSHGDTSGNGPAWCSRGGGGHSFCPATRRRAVNPEAFFVVTSDAKAGRTNQGFIRPIDPEISKPHQPDKGAPA